MAGSGPNGLAAAIVLARAGVRTTVLEAQPVAGGGLRSAELTLPGFVHDICSAAHPLGIASPFYRTLPLGEHGLSWIHSPYVVTHPLDDGTAGVLEQSVENTAARLGPDAAAWRRAVGPLVPRWKELAGGLLGPALRLPEHPLLMARFGALAARSAQSAARARFRAPTARALFAGIAAHSMLPLDHLLSGAFGWVLTLAGHANGWPIPRGGAQRFADALVSCFRSLGGTVETNTRVRSLAELRDADMLLCDVTPRQLLDIAGDELPLAYRRRLEAFRHGPGVFKMDFALSGPIPWKARECALSATVHLGGTLEEIAASERAPFDGAEAAEPFVLLVQPSLFDSSRCPAGMHTAWAYCHVPNGSTAGMSERIEARIERYAPGFRAGILARSAWNTRQLQEHDENLQGGDIGGGATTPRQFLFRPTASLYRTPRRGLYLCSSSTPPGGGVHGMCGYHAAQRALADFGWPPEAPPRIRF